MNISIGNLEDFLVFSLIFLTTILITLIILILILITKHIIHRHSKAQV
jgi:hypothetical protein